MNTFKQLMLPAVLSTLFTGCSPPPDTAVLSRSGGAGIVYEVKLEEIYPIYVSRLFSGRLREAGRELGNLVGENITIGEVTDTTTVNASRQFGEFVAGFIEDRYIANECQYFFTTADPILLKRIEGNINFRFTRGASLDVSYQSEIANHRRELEEFRRAVREAQNRLFQNGGRNAEEAYLKILVDYGNEQSAYLARLDDKLNTDRADLLPGETTVAIVNRCRDVSPGALVYVVSYRDGYVIEPIPANMPSKLHLP